jgi:hypothetical protein
MILVKHKNLKNVCGLLYYVYGSVGLVYSIKQTPSEVKYTTYT